MKTQEFVEKLKKLIPDNKYLIDSNLSDKFILRLTNNYDITLKVSVFAEYDNEIVNLIKNYNTKNIGWLQVFLTAEVEKFNEYSKFGTINGDPLIFDNLKNIFLADHELYEQTVILFSVAKNDESFLDALLIYAEIYINRILDNIDTHDNIINSDYANKCATAAGGEMYLPFYNFLLGVGTANK